LSSTLNTRNSEGDLSLGTTYDSTSCSNYVKVSQRNFSSDCRSSSNGINLVGAIGHALISNSLRRHSKRHGDRSGGSHVAAIQSSQSHRIRSNSLASLGLGNRAAGNTGNGVGNVHSLNAVANAANLDLQVSTSLSNRLIGIRA